MGNRDHRHTVSRRSLRRSFALACATLFLMAGSTQAGTILQFNQNSSNDVVNAVESGGVTTLSTGGPFIAVGLLNFNGLTFIPPLPANETYTNVQSVGAATMNGGTISQLFSGTISFTLGANEYLTATFTNAVFSGAAGGHSASLNATAPDLTFTSNQASFGPITGMSIGFSGIGALAITNDSVASFSAQNTGTFSAAIPEPSALCLGSLAVFMGALGAYGRKRMKNELAN